MANIGGITDVPAGSENSVKYQDLARFAVQDFNQKQNALLEFVKVLGVKQQEVAGMMYYITLEAIDGGKKKTYETKIWEKEWEKFKEVQEFKLVGDDTIKIGGITDVPAGSENSVKYQDLARFAVQDFNQKQNARLEFVKVLSVKQQVVSGMMYYITLEAIDGGKKKTYETMIWVKEWEKFKEVQEFKLAGDDDPDKRGITDVPGGSENSVKYEDLARFAVQDFNQKQNALLEFVKVLSVKQQVVQGIMYYITLEAIDGGKKKTYETKIWVKEWENFKEVQEFKLAGDAPGS
ncbi:multicystatin-like [Lycium barbarum]|uniref:multicystatin-like n=1 Tax=Lycium barbarum TaxID=112863 RepID=UPI00293EA60B|nr:multicystatin-like [Lycium barbarum]